MKKKYKWGILAPGKMSAKFTRGLKLLDNAELYAVGSRDIERARQFAEEFGFKKSYGSYEELAADKEVDIIYIASPHSHHHDHTMLCLRNGKAVICEKAFALNSSEAEEMIAEAERQKVFLMEALWPPFQPIYRKTKEILLEVNRANCYTLMQDSHSSLHLIPPTENSTLLLEEVLFSISEYIRLWMLFISWVCLMK